MRNITAWMAVALATFLAPPANSAEPDALDELVAASDRQVPSELLRLQHRLQSLHREKLTSAERKQQGDVLRDRAKAVREKRVYLSSKMPMPLKAGAVGTIQPVRVTQVIDENSVLVEIGLSRSKTSAIIKGIKTAGMVDDSRYELKETFQVVEPHQYTTVLGASRTVIALEPFDPAPIEKYLNARADAKKLGGNEPPKKAATGK